MTKININFNNENEKAAFVTQCEREFEDKLYSVCEKVASHHDLKLITLAGPTCAGKTTTANKLISDLSVRGKTAHVVSIDDFFRNRDNMKIPGSDKIDYDSVKAIDLEYLEKCIKDLYSGNIVKLPDYDFVTGTRCGYNEFKPHGDDILIFEGIQAVYPEVTALLDNQNIDYASIFINVTEDFELNGTLFDKREIRLIRRLVRDYKFRSASPEFTFKIWKSVMENEDKNILPYENKTDIQINSLLPYEIFLIKSYLIPILDEVHPESEYRKTADEMIKKIEAFDDISYAYVPENSVYKEFLG